MGLIERLRDGDPWDMPYACQLAAHEAADAITESLAIARELARLAVNMNGNPIGSVGTQVAMLEALERRVGVRE